MPAIETITTTPAGDLFTAKTFIEALRPSNEAWFTGQNITRDWIFRGHWNAQSWPLSPSLFRQQISNISYDVEGDVWRTKKRYAPPAKSWRNWYRVYKRMGVTRNVGVWNPGVTPGPNIFPSKEMAEQKAHEFVALVFPHARSWFDYMGAFPESEEPDE